MKKALLALWIAFPLAALLLHLSAGNRIAAFLEPRSTKEARQTIAAARRMIRLSDPLAAAQKIELLLGSYPAPPLPSPLQNEAHALAAEAHYYMAYALRLEDASRDMWVEEIEAARQHLQILCSEITPRTPTAEANAYRKNMELVVRLAQMAPSEVATKDAPPISAALRDKGALFQKNAQRGALEPAESE